MNTTSNAQNHLISEFAHLHYELATFLTEEGRSKKFKKITFQAWSRDINQEIQRVNGVLTLSEEFTNTVLRCNIKTDLLLKRAKKHVIESIEIPPHVLKLIDIETEIRFLNQQIWWKRVDDLVASQLENLKSRVDYLPDTFEEKYRNWIVLALKNLETKFSNTKRHLELIKENKQFNNNFSYSFGDAQRVFLSPLGAKTLSEVKKLEITFDQSCSLEPISKLINLQTLKISGYVSEIPKCILALPHLQTINCAYANVAHPPTEEDLARPNREPIEFVAPVWI